MATILSTSPSHGLPRMSDHFWANDNTALNNILDRLLKSKRTCETIVKMFEKRAHIEQDYGEQLLKLSQIRLSESEESSSTFSETLQSIPTATEAAARAHIDLAQQIHHLLETPLSDFIKEQKAIRKSTMSEIDKIQNLRYMHLENVKRARHAYLTECDNLKKYAGDRPGNELMQMKQKTATVDHEYKLSVGILESVTKNWIEEWKESCNIFQELEEKRLSYLSGTLLAYATMISNVYTLDDQSCDRIRSALDNVDIVADINTFIQEKGTGTAVPELPKYTCHHDFDQIPEPTVQVSPRTVREINIPVKDEELRSVNDQLRKLPSTRPHTAESTHEKSPSSPIRTIDEKTETEIPTVDQLREKALPQLPPNQKHKENNVYTAQIDFGHTDQPAIDKDIDDYHLATIQRSPTSIPYPHEPVVEQRATANASSPHLPSSATMTTQPRKPRGLSSPSTEHERQIPATAPVVQYPTAGFHEQEPVEPFPRKGKKKNKHYSVFPFLKKKSDPTNESGKPRFSLALLGQKKEERKSPTSSANTSPQSISFPTNVYSTSPVENRFNTISSRLTLEDGTPVLEYVKAQWSYDAKIDSEITFSKNDILAVIEKKKDGWWDAQIVHSDRRASFARGLVPGNFMETYM